MTHFTSLAAVTLASLAISPSAAQSPSSNSSGDTKVYELRTYYAAPGKLDDLQARFRNHTTKLFEKHGMQNIGYWVPVENPDSKLIYILAYPTSEAREKSWKAFMGDPEWQQAYKASEVKGKLVAKAESQFLQATDYSPPIQPASSSEPRLFELRTYTAAPGKLNDLNKRFRDHTVQLFTKHGIRNIAYWVPAKKDPGADNTLIYLVAHQSKEAAEHSWKAFREDPQWVAAKSASEVNGALTAPGGVKALLLLPTDYSALR